MFDSSRAMFYPRSDSGIDPLPTYGTPFPRRVEPEGPAAGEILTVDSSQGVTVTKLRILADSETRALKASDKVEWRGMSWEIVTVIPLVGVSRKMLISIKALT